MASCQPKASQVAGSCSPGHVGGENGFEGGRQAKTIGGRQNKHTAKQYQLDYEQLAIETCAKFADIVEAHKVEAVYEARQHDECDEKGSGTGKPKLGRAHA